jgi:hypothetical protein
VEKPEQKDTYKNTARWLGKVAWQEEPKPVREQAEAARAERMKGVETPSSATCVDELATSRSIAIV